VDEWIACHGMMHSTQRKETKEHSLGAISPLRLEGTAA
jgi:hypothetical protein